MELQVSDKEAQMEPQVEVGVKPWLEVGVKPWVEVGVKLDQKRQVELSV